MTQRYFFAPGPVPMSETIDISFSHRSKQFADIYRDTVDRLENLTGYYIALIQGSASAAIESVIKGLHLEHKYGYILETGSFATRVLNRLNTTGPYSPSFHSVEALMKALGTLDESTKPKFCYAVQFETSNSGYNDLTAVSKICQERNIKLIVDAVSAFPYYNIPRADVVILSSSKQLRGLPVLGIVGYRDGIESEYELDTYSYLSMALAVSRGKVGQTPHTSLMPQVLSLHNSLKNKTWQPFVDSIETNAKMLTSGVEEYVIGDSCAPVITFKCSNLDETLDRFEKCGMEVYCNRAYMKDEFQVSCFNYRYSSWAPYGLLNQQIRMAMKEEKDARVMRDVGRS